MVAGHGGSGGRGSGGGDVTLFRCAFGVAVATCKIGVGMDLFYLNAKKLSACRLVWNFTSLRASSVQAPCKFRASSCTCNAFALQVFMQRFRVARAHVGIRGFHTECIRVA